MLGTGDGLSTLSRAAAAKATRFSALSPRHGSAIGAWSSSAAFFRAAMPLEVAIVPRPVAAMALGPPIAPVAGRRPAP